MITSRHVYLLLAGSGGLYVLAVTLARSCFTATYSGCEENSVRDRSFVLFVSDVLENFFELLRCERVHPPRQIMILCVAVIKYGKRVRRVSPSQEVPFRAEGTESASLLQQILSHYHPYRSLRTPRR